MTTGILVDVVMPQMGVSVSEGTITRWAKNVGDTIAADETIVEISTDKVDTEIPSPASGVVRELLAEEGETVPVNTRIAVIDTGGAGAAAGQSEPPATPPSTPAERVAAQPAEMPAPAPPPPPAAAPAAADHTTNGSSESPDQAGRSFVSPVVARMLAEHNLDINQIPGTGSGGRVTKRDVRQFIESGGAAAPEPVAEPAPEVHDVPHFSASLEDAIIEPARRSRGSAYAPRRQWHRHHHRPSSSPPPWRHRPQRPPRAAARSCTASRPSAR